MVSGRDRRPSCCGRSPGFYAGCADYRRRSLVVVVVFVREWVKVLNSSIDSFAPKIKSPVNERAIEFISVRVLDNDSPVANSRLTPTIESVRARHQVEIERWTHQ